MDQKARVWNGVTLGGVKLDMTKARGALTVLWRSRSGWIDGAVSEIGLNDNDVANDQGPVMASIGKLVAAAVFW